MRKPRIPRRRGTVIIEPLSEDWGWLDTITAKLDDDFIEAVNEQPAQQERPTIGEFVR